MVFFRANATWHAGSFAKTRLLFTNKVTARRQETSRADILLPVMLYRLPGFLELLIPLGLFIGIFMAYGRLYVESEMLILGACGAGRWRSRA